ALPPRSPLFPYTTLFRSGNTQSLRANINASYSPDGLDVPIIFFASGNTDFQAVAQAKSETLEINRIQLDQGPARFAAGYVSFPRSEEHTSELQSRSDLVC